MAHANISLKPRLTHVVGSFGSARDLDETASNTLKNACDLVEIRLDLLLGESKEKMDPRWLTFTDIPLLFTARRHEEGGASPLTATQRMKMLKPVLAYAALVDIEVASIGEMGEILSEIRHLGIPWVASYHDFEKLPTTQELARAATKAKEAGATVFKAAAKLASPSDMARLAEFQLTEHGILVATMGMGPLAPVSRLLCAQSGSVLNYGFIGKTATAPGQWDSSLLKHAISRLSPFGG